MGILLSAILSLTVLIKLLPNSIGDGWIDQQLHAYTQRIVGGLTLFAEGRDASYAYRQAENVNLWTAIREAPLFGHGLGYQYQTPFGPADSFTATIGPYFAHNYYLWLFAKSGIIGLVSFAVFALVPIIRAVRASSWEAKVSGIVAVTLLLVSVVAPVGESGPGALVLGIALGASMSFSRPGSSYPVGFISDARQDLPANHQFWASPPEVTDSVR